MGGGFERPRELGKHSLVDGLQKASSAPAAGKRTLVEDVSRQPGPQPIELLRHGPDATIPVQRKVDPGYSDIAELGRARDDAGTVQRAARAGVADAGGTLPHAERIQHLFGRHDISGVKAHVGGAAATASHAIGAEAYATGNHVAFAREPDLHTAAHEAAHVVQQRGGVQLKGGVGEAGDAYERHADEVADRVVRGESAADLLPSGGSSPGTAAVQLQSAAQSVSAPAPAAPAKPAQPASQASFLSESAHAELIRRLGLRIGTAAANYNIAVTEVKLARLIKKPEDLPWVVGLLLDVVGAHFTMKLTATLTSLKKAENDILLKLGEELKEGESWRSQAYASLLKTSDAAIGSYTKIAIANAQKSATSTVKSLGGQSAHDTTAQGNSFLNELRGASGRAFQDLQDRISGVPDAELVALYDAFDVDKHTVDQYVTELNAKVSRFESSGVLQIGRNTVGAPFEAPDDASERGRNFHDTGGYVIWRSYLSGYPKQLIYQRGGRARPNNPHTDNSDNPRHGGEDGVSVPKGNWDFFPAHVVAVPDEFREAAIARHQQVWGSPPGAEVYDDSGSSDPQRAAAAKKNKAGQQVAPAPNAKTAPSPGASTTASALVGSSSQASKTVASINVADLLAPQDPGISCKVP